MNNSNNLPVVCVRANDTSFLGLLRSVGSVESADLFPVVFSWNGEPDWLSSASKYFQNVTEITNPAEDEFDAVNQLVGLGRKIFNIYGKKALVLCSSDVNEILFQSNAHLLSPFFYLPGSRTIPIIRNDVSDKSLFFKIMERKLPFLIPKTTSVSNIDEMSVLDQWSTFPCVVKPAVKDLSQTFYKLHNGKKAVVVTNHRELKALTAGLIELGFPLVVQEYIEFGPVEDEVPAYCLFDRCGNVIHYCNCIKSFVYPAKFGTALIVEASVRDELKEAAFQIGRAINWFGPLMIEFIWDRRKDRYLVLEINTRPWLFHDFYRLIGLPFVSDYLRILQGESVSRYCETERATKAIKYCDLLALLRASPESVDTVDQYEKWLISTVGLEEGGTVLLSPDDPSDQGPNIKFLRILKKEFGITESFLDKYFWTSWKVVGSYPRH